MAKEVDKKPLLFQKSTEETTLIQGVAYNEASIALLNDWLVSQRAYYIDSKNVFSVPKDTTVGSDVESGVFSSSESNPQKKMEFTSTPHPIGNTCLAASLLLDTISRIEHLNIRLQLYKQSAYEKNPGKYKEALIRYLEDLRYPDDHLKESKKQLEAEKDEGVKKQLEAYHSITTKINVDIKHALGTLTNPSNLESLQDFSKHLQKNMATLLVNIGIPTEVLCPQVQALQIARKDIWLARHGSTRTWHGVDGDGDPSNHMKAVLSMKEGHGWADMHGQADERKAEDTLAIQPRLSCKDGKKGVKGVNSHLGSINGVSRAESLADLVNIETFDPIYKKFKMFFMEQKVSKEHEINHTLDFIARTAANSFHPLGVSSQGFVLSDFDTKNGKKTIIQLMALMACVDQYNQEYLPKNKKEEKVNINQPVLPLSENLDDIKNIPKVMEGLFTEIGMLYTQLAKTGDKAGIDKLRSLLITRCGRFAFGPFSGPSDLTNEVGFMSGWLLEEARSTILGYYRTLQETVPFLKGVELPMEYGIGTSPRRGANIPRPAHAATMQGSGHLATSFAQKQAMRMGNTQSPPEKRKAPFTDAYIEHAIDAHRALFPSDGSAGLSAEYDRLIKDKDHQAIFQVVERKYLNNQGTRGKDGVPEYKEQRAITCASIAALFGFNGCGTPLPDKIEQHKKEYNRTSVLNSSSGLKLMIDELFQLCTFDKGRLECLGVSQDVREGLDAYCEGVISLARASKTEYDGKDGYAPVVHKMVDSMLEEKELHPITRRALLHFQEQIPHVTTIRNVITTAVRTVSLQANPSVGDYANLAFAVNQIANFQGLPKIPEDFGISHTDQFLEEKPDLRLREVKARQAEQPLQKAA